MPSDRKKPANALSPIDNSSIVDKIIDRIVKAISTGQFKVGEKLPSEFELMEELNVGRNSLREAMKILSALGVVDIRRGDGTYVCDHIAPTVFNPIIYSIIFQAESDPDMVEFRECMEAVSYTHLPHFLLAYYTTITSLCIGFLLGFKGPISKGFMV